MAVSLDGSIVTTYCDPIDVIKAIRMVDLYSTDGGLLKPSDSTLPDYDELCKRIVVAEKFIDRYTGQSWRPNRESTEIMDINTYWHDINGVRSEYWQQGGYYVPLRSPILPFDPAKGDKIEIRTMDNKFVNISQNGVSETLEADGTGGDGVRPTGNKYLMGAENGTFWFDYQGGKLYLRLGYYLPKQNGLRISYRWGDVSEVPPDISRATALKVGLTLLNEELYLTRLGTGGDLGGSKNDMKRGMQDEINEIIMANRSFTSVFSAYD